MVGTLVHRLLQRFGFDGDAEPLTRQNVLALFHARSTDRAEAADGSAGDVCDRALAAYRAICSRPEVRSLYTSGDRWHEVPFTMRLGESVWRGTIDCLVQTSPTTITVLEFKTGRRRAEHDAQLQLYRDAVARLFPGMTIETRLVYPGAPAPVRKYPPS
jgi:ATP-dependent exoDNAse (exonuclease V) beta subunit